MLIGLVRDSVLRCFCQSCSVNSALQGRSHMAKKPLTKKGNKKPKCKQPKKARRYQALARTEIRSEEKSRGGLCYEVVLANPTSPKPPSPPSTPKAKTTVQDINMKLDKAEERRKSYIDNRLQQVGDLLNRLEEASKKREEANEKFIAQTKVALNDKLDVTGSNRDAYLMGLKAKISDHLESVEAARKQLDQQTTELQEAIDAKLSNAEEKRNDNVKKMLDKLDEHEKYCQKVRLGHELAIKDLEERISSKLDLAEKNRETEKLKKLESLRELNAKPAQVKAAKEEISKGKTGEGQENICPKV